MEHLLPIGEMARLNHVTVAALRLYADKGLLKPAAVNPATGYRYYDIKQTGRLDLIKTLKSLGMSLDEIKTILDRGRPEEIEDILKKKKQEINAGIDHLQLQEAAIDHCLKALERYRSAPPEGTLTLEYIEERRIYAIPAKIDFYAYEGIDMYERTLSLLRDDLAAHHLPSLNYYNAGTTVDVEDFSQGLLKAKEIFVFVQPEFPADTRCLSRGIYACTYVDGYSSEPAYAEKLRQWCLRNQYTLTGDYICEIITEMNLFEASTQRSMFLRLQVPVSFGR
jgi:DNA-binding transcriptional MerR regulator